MNKEMFNHLLDDKEEIVKVFKPNKNAFYIGHSFLAVFLIFFFTIFFSIVGVGFGAMRNQDFMYVPIFAIFVFLLTIVMTIVFIPKAYENTWYAYTTKRLLIRTGIIGVNYQTMELKLVGAINVKEGISDKLINKNTGSIYFSSPSNPIRSDGKQQDFVFKNISNHYQVYKELKNVIDEIKMGKQI